MADRRQHQTEANWPVVSGNLDLPGPGNGGTLPMASVPTGTPQTIFNQRIKKMDTKALQSIRAWEIAQMLMLFSKHQNTLRHSQCVSAGINDPYAVAMDLSQLKHRVRCAFVSPPYGVTESVYDLLD